MFAHDFPRLSGMILEGVTTFFLVLMVFATAVDERGTFRPIAGFAIGLTHHPGHHGRRSLHRRRPQPRPRLRPRPGLLPLGQPGVYWVGPLAGGFLAGLLYDSLFLKKA